MMLLTFSGYQSQPLKVFNLASQSNMERHTRIETFDDISDDPAILSLLKHMFWLSQLDSTPFN
ncbi:hypothetical protein Spb1_04740 [Planctopirus ephydatiae]|uniref:Uncharacterized protein n=1 Tax=Planctopirus ephydatiae TaxID=2528019 RepID=A0A518GJ44_9PLAN|nr:hypothetical protein Spb1_04740 [Planctopirus ephydatiae]